MMINESLSLVATSLQSRVFKLVDRMRSLASVTTSSRPEIHKFEIKITDNI